MSPTGSSPLLSPTGGDSSIAFSDTMLNNLMTDVKQVIESKQTENIEEFKIVGKDGKSIWQKTHFIFMIDCSGSMKGSRWESVTTGFRICLEKIKKMKDVYVTAFTFDSKVNPFCRERVPMRAIAHAKEIPFSGKGTNYKRPLEYAMQIMKKSKNQGFLCCLMFLSDGLGGYPTSSLEDLKEMRNSGTKIVFYTIACETDEDEDMIKMSRFMGGEHYKIINADASKAIFAAILNV